jgi:CheY-like chemotaxis protein
VWVASDGSAGIDAIENVQPDVALIDIGLPSIDGYEVARQVNKRGLTPRPLMVALTGYNAPEQRERALKSGFDIHLAKPAEPEQLLELLRQPLPSSACA